MRGNIGLQIGGLEVWKGLDVDEELRFESGFDADRAFYLSRGEIEELIKYLQGVLENG